jgi:sugar lactone lactonase YvrE
VYVGDSGPQVIYKYDFNGETGEISNRETLIEGLGKGVINDGMAVE